MTSLTPTGATGARLALPGNSKLGPGIFSFSIPAEHTCPGRTVACALACYAKRGHFIHAITKKRHRLNYEASLEADFASQMIAAIRHHDAKTIRLHAAGDFYSSAYVAAWTKIARRCRGTSFYWYTRSWRTPELLGPLTAFAALPNVFGWWSEDRDTGPSPETPGVRAAFLVLNRDDDALVTDRHDIVFRDKKHLKQTEHALKRIAGRLVCPVEQAVERQSPLTCSTCRICFTRGRGSQAPRR